MMCYANAVTLLVHAKWPPFIKRLVATTKAKKIVMDVVLDPVVLADWLMLWVAPHSSNNTAGSTPLLLGALATAL